jgi:hypothetical protein
MELEVQREKEVRRERLKWIPTYRRTDRRMLVKLYS